jgi:hypothetical protein
VRTVAFVAPFPLETSLRFARAAAALPGVRLVGLMQEPPRGPDLGLFAEVIRLKDGLDARQITEGAAYARAKYGGLHRILGILEPLQVQLAEARRALGVPGTRPETAALFRDKAEMKDELRRHGLPCARHRRVATAEDAAAFARDVGLPIVLKPTAGMACKSTWRVRAPDELRSALAAMGPSPDHPVLAEEFLSGREYSYDTVTVGGQVRFESFSRYFPGPLEVMETPWIQWVCVVPRHVDTDEFSGARELGRRAIAALGLDTGFTHMEWFRRGDGSLAIGEIAARPPGAHLVRMNSLAHDTDLYRAWARAEIDGAFDGPFERRFAVGCAFLRGAGQGRVRHVSGVDRAQAQVGHLVVEARLPTVGAPKSDSYEGDGHVIVRHPDTEVVKAALTTVIETIQVHYA